MHSDSRSSLHSIGQVHMERSLIGNTVNDPPEPKLLVGKGGDRPDFHVVPP